MVKKKNNWADKYDSIPKAQTGQNIPATRKDSLTLKNNSQRLLKDLLGKGYEFVKDTPFNTGLQDKAYNEVVSKFNKGVKTNFVQPGTDMLEKADLDPASYRTKIDNNRYKQKELNHTIINNDIEPELHDKRIEGLKMQVLLNKKTGDFINHTDYGFEFKPRLTTSTTSSKAPTEEQSSPKFKYNRGPIENPRDTDTLSKRNTGVTKVKQYSENDLKHYNKNKEVNQPTLGNLQQPMFQNGGKFRADLGKKDILTKKGNYYVDSKNNPVTKNDKGVYTPVQHKPISTVKQGTKKTKKELEKEQETIKEMQSNKLGLRAPLHYLANPDHMLGDIGNATGFKPLTTLFENSDKDANRYNKQSVDPSVNYKDRLKTNFNEGTDLLAPATANLVLGTLASKTPLGALKEAYNPIPLPYSTGMKYDPTDYWKWVNNNSDTAGLLNSKIVSEENARNFLNDINTKSIKNNLGESKMELPVEFLEKLAKKKEANTAIESMKADLMDPETIRRADALGVDPELLEQAANNMRYTSDNVPSSFNSSDLEININPNQIGTGLEDSVMAGITNSLSPNFTANEIGFHEVGHLFQDTNYWKNAYPRSINGVERKILQSMKHTPEGKKMLSYYPNHSTRDAAPTSIDEMLGELDMKDVSDDYFAQKNKNYFKNASNQYGTDTDNKIERLPMFREYRQGMRDSGILKNKWDDITPEHIQDYQKLKPEARLNSFIELNEKNYNILNQVGKIAPAVVPLGLGAVYQEEDVVNPLNSSKSPVQFKKGGVIKDNRGQWAHPGEITEIGSNRITMQGVNYPVLGISDTGDKQMMYPGEEYKFDGEKVTEYPMLQKGGTVYVDSKYEKLLQKATITPRAQDGKTIPKTNSQRAGETVGKSVREYLPFGDEIMDFINSEKIETSKQLEKDETDTKNVFKYFQEYLKSPKFNERSDNLGYSEKSKQDRLSAINNTTVTINRNSDKNKQSTGSFFSPAEGVKLYPIKDERIAEYNNERDVTRFGKPYKINYNDISGTAAHELSHAQNRNINRDTKLADDNTPWGDMNREEQMLLLNNNLKAYGPGVDKIKEDQRAFPNDYNLPHDLLPSESKADIDAFRYDLWKNNIYNPGTEDFDESHLKKSKSSYYKDRLQNHFSDEDLIMLMNKTASNDINKNNTIKATIFSKAKNGKKITNFTTNTSSSKGWMDKYQ